jgi:hypothetical protein
MLACCNHVFNIMLLSDCDKLPSSQLQCIIQGPGFACHYHTLCICTILNNEGGIQLFTFFLQSSLHPLGS